MTCSPQDSPASRFRSPDSERERMMTATSGRRLSELYTKSDPLGLLERTLLESSRWFSPARRLKWEAVPLCSEKITEKEYCCGKNTSSKPCAVTLREKDMKSGRLLFRLVPSERPIEETACGLLPTVQTQGLKRCNAEGKTEFVPLYMLPTPTSIDAGSGRINKSPSTGAKERPTIALAARMGLLPSPVASDATTGAIIGGCDKFVTTGNGTNGSVGLARAVQLLPTPNATEGEKYTTKYNPDSQMGKGLTAMAVNGLLPTPRSNKANDVNLNNPKMAQRNKGNLEESVAEMIQGTPYKNGGISQLNPLFVEEMMGFPLMWTTLPFLSPNGEQNP